LEILGQGVGPISVGHTVPQKSGKKSGKTLTSCLMGKIPYFRVFPLFGGIICQMILFSNVLSYLFNGKQNFV
jgi:hypothetical protein